MALGSGCGGGGGGQDVECLDRRWLVGDGNCGVLRLFASPSADVVLSVIFGLEPRHYCVDSRR